MYDGPNLGSVVLYRLKMHALHVSLGHWKCNTDKIAFAPLLCCVASKLVCGVVGLKHFRCAQFCRSLAAPPLCFVVFELSSFLMDMCMQ